MVLVDLKTTKFIKKRGQCSECFGYSKELNYKLPTGYGDTKVRGLVLELWRCLRNLKNNQPIKEKESVGIALYSQYVLLKYI